ncbi:MAG: DUF1684 domain-containing protein [Propionibacteriaceae bacterium]
MRPVQQLDVVDWRRRTHELYTRVRTLAPEAGHDLWRSERDAMFATHPASPIIDRSTFAGLRVAPYDPSWRFEVPLRSGDGHQILVGTGTDGDVAFRRVGTVELPFGTLDVWWHQGYGGGLFLPVRDGLAGWDTYGGGRYLLDTIKGADLGSRDAGLVIDVNFAYQPSCAYDPAWACPLAQPGNVVEVGLRVGELSA